MGARTMHPFPARMAPDIALNAIPERAGDRLVIFDPMCGSGTVLSAALERGHNALGIDIDPLAVMMSELAVTAVDQTALLSAATECIEAARTRESGPPWGEDRETADFVNYWFGGTQAQQLANLVGAISEIDSRELRLALRLAISRIIVTKSPQASLAADAAHSRPHRVQLTSDYDVLDGFRRSSARLARILAMREIRGVGEVKMGDARRLDGVDRESVDIVVTSPPYLNALDYLRGHKLALVWFGHTIRELRERRSTSIGSERRPDGSVDDRVARIVDEIEAEAASPETFRRPMIERFASDCVAFADELARVVRQGGAAVLVVGNSTLRGNYIRTDGIARSAMESAGFELRSSVVRPIPANSRYMAINTKQATSTIANRMRDEVVLTLAR